MQVTDHNFWTSGSCWRNHKLNAVAVALFCLAVTGCTGETSSPTRAEFLYIGDGPNNGKIFPSPAGGTNQAVSRTADICKKIDATRPLSLSSPVIDDGANLPERWEFKCVNASGYYADPRTKPEHEAASTAFLGKDVRYWIKE
ncbi:hypothetical protein ACOTTU_15185 [Roseobacter sp. EG26]